MNTSVHKCTSAQRWPASMAARYVSTVRYASIFAKKYGRGDVGPLDPRTFGP